MIDFSFLPTSPSLSLDVSIEQRINLAWPIRYSYRHEATYFLKVSTVLHPLVSFGKLSLK